MDGNEIAHKSRLLLPSNLQCPKCQKELRNTTYIQAINIVCTSCSSIYHTKKKQVTGKLTKKVEPLIPIGTRGKLKGVTYEVVGHIKFRELKTIYTWNEYTLFNPVYGYLYLSEFNGHWSFTEHTYIFPMNEYRRFELIQHTFDQYNDYRASIDYAVGEFNWDLLDCSKIKITEFISPPYMLVKEESFNDLIWYKSEHIEEKEIRKAFNLDKGIFPEKVGVGPLQLTTTGQTISLIKGVSVVAFFLVLLIQLIFQNILSEKIVFKEHYGLDSTKTIVTSSFKLEGSIFGEDNLEVELYAPVDNSWFEGAITLVNDVTGEEYYFEQGVEYYHGYDDGYWREGENTTSKVLSSIPDGTYHMNIVPTADTSSIYKVSYFEIMVKKGIPMWSNFFIIIIAISVYPLIQHIRNNYFEYQRWFNSKYSDG